MQVLPLIVHSSRGEKKDWPHPWKENPSLILHLADVHESLPIPASEISHRHIYFSTFGKISLVLASLHVKSRGYSTLL